MSGRYAAADTSRAVKAFAGAAIAHHQTVGTVVAGKAEIVVMRAAGALFEGLEKPKRTGYNLKQK